MNFIINKTKNFFNRFFVQPYRRVKSALKFAEGVKAQGIAELQNFWLAYDERLLWCSWETNNLEGLKAAFSELNKRSGLKSKLIAFEKIPIE